MRTEWNTFKGGVWQREINVRDFIQKNYTPYDGNDQFLEGPTQSTTELWDQVMELSKKELEAGGVLDMDTKVISTITSHGPGYLNKDKETIVGFQTDKPFKRSLQPYGGIRMAMKACQDNGFEVDPEVVDFFTKHRKTHNAGVFDAYTDEMPFQPYHNRTSGRLRTRQDNWRLPQDRSLRSGCPDPGKERRKGFHTYHYVL